MKLPDPLKLFQNAFADSPINRERSLRAMAQVGQLLFGSISGPIAAQLAGEEQADHENGQFDAWLEREIEIQQNEE